MQNLRVVPLGFQQLTLAGVASLTVPAGANMAIWQADTQAARWRDDGTAPTATVGIQVLTTSAPYEYFGNLSAVQFIQATAGSILNVSYYKVVG
jgi:hypothetical protein